MRLKLAVLLMIGLSLTVCGCSTTTAVARTSSSSELLAAGCVTDLNAQELDALLAMDFSTGISTCEFISPLDDGGAAYGTWLPASIQQPVLTEGEGRLLGMTYTPPDGRRYIAETLGYVSRFYNSTGRLPLNGVELISKVLIRDGLDEILAMEPGEQYHHLYAAVNPVTGRFFTDFGDSEWHPGGVYFEQVTDQELITERYHNAVSSSSGPPAVWRVVVFGENPGTILIDKYIAANCHQRTTPMPRTVNTTVTEK